MAGTVGGESRGVNGRGIPKIHLNDGESGNRTGDDTGGVTKGQRIISGIGQPHVGQRESRELCGGDGDAVVMPLVVEGFGAGGRGGKRGGAPGEVRPAGGLGGHLRRDEHDKLRAGAGHDADCVRDGDGVGAFVSGAGGGDGEVRVGLARQRRPCFRPLIAERVGSSSGHGEGHGTAVGDGAALGRHGDGGRVQRGEREGGSVVRRLWINYGAGDAGAKGERPGDGRAQGELNEGGGGVVDGAEVTEDLVAGLVARAMAGGDGDELSPRRNLVGECDRGGRARAVVRELKGVGNLASHGDGVGAVRAGGHGHTQVCPGNDGDLVIFHFAIGGGADGGEVASGGEPKAGVAGACLCAGRDSQEQRVGAGDEGAVGNHLVAGGGPVRVVLPVHPRVEHAVGAGNNFKGGGLPDGPAREEVHAVFVVEGGGVVGVGEGAGLAVEIHIHGGSKVDAAVAIDDAVACSVAGAQGGVAGVGGIAVVKLDDGEYRRGAGDGAAGVGDDDVVGAGIRASGDGDGKSGELSGAYGCAVVAPLIGRGNRAGGGDGEGGRIAVGDGEAGGLRGDNRGAEKVEFGRRRAGKGEKFVGDDGGEGGCFVGRRSGGECVGEVRRARDGHAAALPLNRVGRRAGEGDLKSGGLACDHELTAGRGLDADGLVEGARFNKSCAIGEVVEIEGTALAAAAEAEGEIVGERSVGAGTGGDVECAGREGAVTPDRHAMGTRVGGVVLDGDPEFVEGCRIKRKQIGGAGFTGVHRVRARVPVELVHVEAGLPEIIRRAGGGVFDGLGEAEAKELAVGAALPCGAEAEHAFAIAVVHETIGGVGQLHERIGGGSQPRAQGDSDAVVEQGVRVGDGGFLPNVVGELKAAIVKRPAGGGGHRVFDREDAAARAQASGEAVAGTTPVAGPGVGLVVPGAVEPGGLAAGNGVARVKIAPTGMGRGVGGIVGGADGEADRGARDRALGIRNGDGVEPGLVGLNAGEGQQRIGGGRERSAITTPLKRERSGASGGDLEIVAGTFDHVPWLGRRGDLRRGGEERVRREKRDDDEVEKGGAGAQGRKGKWDGEKVRK